MPPGGSRTIAPGTGADDLHRLIAFLGGEHGQSGDPDALAATLRDILDARWSAGPSWSRRSWCYDVKARGVRRSALTCVIGQEGSDIGPKSEG